MAAGGCPNKISPATLDARWKRVAGDIFVLSEKSDLCLQKKSVIDSTLKLASKFIMKNKKSSVVNNEVDSCVDLSGDEDGGAGVMVSGAAADLSLSGGGGNKKLSSSASTVLSDTSDVYNNIIISQIVSGKGVIQSLHQIQSPVSCQFEKVCVNIYIYLDLCCYI